MIKALGYKGEEIMTPRFKTYDTASAPLKTMISDIRAAVNTNKQPYIGTFTNDSGYPCTLFCLQHRPAFSGQQQGRLFGYLYEDEDGTQHEFLGWGTSFSLDGVQTNNFPTRYKTIAEFTVRDIIGDIYITWPNSNWQDMLYYSSDGTTYTVKSFNYSNMNIDNFNSGTIDVIDHTKTGLKSLPAIEKKVEYLVSSAANLYVSR